MGSRGQIALCPGCQRIRDKLPAGEITLEGAFVHAHQAELVRLVRNEAEHEGKEHPLHRIMHLDEDVHRVAVSTTDIHLPNGSERHSNAPTMASSKFTTVTTSTRCASTGGDEA